MTRPLVLLILASHLADLATFGLAVRAQGIGGELGPLAIVYGIGGFGAVAVVKLAGVLLVLAILALLEQLSRRTTDGAGRDIGLVSVVRHQHEADGAAESLFLGGREPRPDGMTVDRDRRLPVEPGIGAPELGAADAVHLAHPLVSRAVHALQSVGAHGTVASRVVVKLDHGRSVVGAVPVAGIGHAPRRLDHHADVAGPHPRRTFGSVVRPRVADSRAHREGRSLGPLQAAVRAEHAVHLQIEPFLDQMTDRHRAGAERVTEVFIVPLMIGVPVGHDGVAALQDRDGTEQRRCLGLRDDQSAHPRVDPQKRHRVNDLHVHLLPSLYHPAQEPIPVVRRLALLVATVGVIGAFTGAVAIA